MNIYGIRTKEKAYYTRKLTCFELGRTYYLFTTIPDHYGRTVDMMIPASEVIEVLVDKANASLC